MYEELDTRVTRLESKTPEPPPNTPKRRYKKRIDVYTAYDETMARYLTNQGKAVQITLGF